MKRLIALLALSLATASLAGIGPVAAANGKLRTFSVVGAPKPNVLQGGQRYKFRVTVAPIGTARIIVTSSKPNVIPNFTIRADNVPIKEHRVRARPVNSVQTVKLTASWFGKVIQRTVKVSPPKPPAPNLTGPADNAQIPDARPVFNWSGGAGANEFHICVVRANATSCPETASANGRRFKVSGGPYKIPVQYAFDERRGERVKWWVYACNPLGCTTSQGARYVKILPLPARLRSPGQNAQATSRNVTFRWNSAAGARNGYSLFINGQYKIATTQRQITYAIPNNYTGTIEWEVRGYSQIAGVSAPGQGTRYKRALRLPSGSTGGGQASGGNNFKWQTANVTQTDKNTYQMHQNAVGANVMQLVRGSRRARSDGIACSQCHGSNNPQANFSVSNISRSTWCNEVQDFRNASKPNGLKNFFKNWKDRNCPN